MKINKLFRSKIKGIKLYIWSNKNINKSYNKFKLFRYLPMTYVIKQIQTQILIKLKEIKQKK
jgi:hypothetical protein